MNCPYKKRRALRFSKDVFFNFLKFLFYFPITTCILLSIF
ncbi:MAG TPA: hypothetical protein DDW49_02270 [Deltaproteobacteria bacterium]|nr:hypothetical protein [Deltaproteobacteria bacterium]